MPLTLPTHPLVVVPLKLRWPHRFDGVALVLGAVAPDVAAHLPHGGPFALRDYGVLGTVRHRWLVTVMSAVLGAASHLCWDAFTHPTVDGVRPLFAALWREALPGRPWWEVLSTASDVVGFAAAAALALHLGRARVLRRWNGPPPAVATRPVRFWATVAAAALAGAALLPLQPARLAHDQAVRAMLIVGAALLAGAAAHRSRTRT
jgi:hypothetical protein